MPVNNLVSCLRAKCREQFGRIETDCKAKSALNLLLAAGMDDAFARMLDGLLQRFDPNKNKGDRALQQLIGTNHTNIKNDRIVDEVFGIQRRSSTQTKIPRRF